jgi:hypothetical protein
LLCQRRREARREVVEGVARVDHRAQGGSCHGRGHRPRRD